MAKCSFCGNAINQGTGKILALNSGKIVYYCSSKCEKNSKLGRKPIHVKWTKFYQK